MTDHAINFGLCFGLYFRIEAHREEERIYRRRSLNCVRFSNSRSSITAATYRILSCTVYRRCCPFCYVLILTIVDEAGCDRWIVFIAGHLVFCKCERFLNHVRSSFVVFTSNLFESGARKPVG